MKLALTQEQGIEILSAEGTQTAHDFQVLKVGLKKLLTVGKNRIVLELSKMAPPTSETVRELAALDLLARELAGRIVIAGIDSEVAKKIATFAVPPAVPVYATRQEAIDYFVKHPDGPASADGVAPAGETSAPGVAAPTAAGAATAAPASSPHPASPTGATREEVLARERGEVGQLRKTLSELEKRNLALQEELFRLTLKGAPLTTEAQYRERIQSLETALENALLELKSRPNPA
ncbi:MAG: hypothetical protein AB7P04_10025 [Bacteriovoracia bacterium]